MQLMVVVVLASIMKKSRASTTLASLIIQSLPKAPGSFREEPVFSCVDDKAVSPGN
jgi:hypothetical protein